MRDREIKRLGLGISERHLKVVLMKVGLCGFGEHTFREISREFGFANARANQIYDKCIKNIMRHCRRKEVCPFEMHIFEES